MHHLYNVACSCVLSFLSNTALHEAVVIIFLFSIGADFHRSMVATGDCLRRKKLIIGRRPVRYWTRRAISSLFLCRKLHSFLGKSTKTAATRAALFDSKMHQIVCRLGLCPRSTRAGPTCCPPGGVRSVVVPAVFRGLLLKGEEGRKEKGGSSSFALGRKKRKVGAYAS